VRSILAWWYLVIFGAIIAFTAYVWLVRVCAPSLVGTYAFVNPVIAVFLGSAFAGEELSFRTTCGAAVIAAAVALVVFFEPASETSTRPRRAGTAVQLCVHSKGIRNPFGRDPIKVVRSFSALPFVQKEINRVIFCFRGFILRFRRFSRSNPTFGGDSHHVIHLVKGS
jgi:EamA-like transporter family